MLRSLLVIASLLAVPAAAQTHLDAGSGPFGAVDLVGGAFPSYTPAGTDASGALGYRFDNGVDAALLVGYGGAVDDEIFPYPAETHVGAALGFTRGAGRIAWRVEVLGQVSVAGGDTFAFPAGGGPTEVRGGRSVVERWGRVGVMPYVRLGGGPVSARLGVGASWALREVGGSTLVFDAGGPDERAVGGEAEIETAFGLAVALPVTVRLGGGVSLTLDPSVRVERPEAFYYAAAAGQVALQLNL